MNVVIQPISMANTQMLLGLDLQLVEQQKAIIPSILIGIRVPGRTDCA